MKITEVEALYLRLPEIQARTDSRTPVRGGCVRGRRVARAGRAPCLLSR
jgi:hypothetical protein